MDVDGAVRTTNLSQKFNSPTQEFPDRNLITSSRTLQQAHHGKGVMNTSGQVILLAEDLESDALLVEHAFRKAHIQNPIVTVRNGREAVSYLRGEGAFNDRSKFPLPIFVLADITMPEMSGFELLDWIRKDPKFRQLPVIVITSSQNPVDKEKSHTLGATEFFVKGLKLEDLAKLVHAVGASWLLEMSGASSPGSTLPNRSC
jgi:CheY-like chemotaxis protein